MPSKHNRDHNPMCVVGVCVVPTAKHRPINLNKRRKELRITTGMKYSLNFNYNFNFQRQLEGSINCRDLITVDISL